MKVELFIPCIIDQFYPTVGWDMVKILEKLGHEVSYNPAQTCCGMTAFYKGHREAAKEVALKFLKDFNSDTFIVSPSSSCVNMVKRYYDGFFKNTSNHNIYRNLQGNIKELSEFLIDVAKVEQLPSVFEAKAFYVHTCNAVNDLNIIEQPVKLLKMVEGLELTESSGFVSCCGYGGDFSANYEPLSVEMAKAKYKPALDIQAEYLISNEQLCAMHMQGVADKAKHPIKNIHLASVLAAGFE